jgi:adenylate kinase family enzyme
LKINNKLIKHYLKNVLFITGTAYAGKTTQAKMLSDKYNLILCAENYDCVPDNIITKEKYPNIYYWKTINDWQEYINRTPEKFSKWMMECIKEHEEFEIAYLMHISKYQKVIVDTGLSVETLREIADYKQIAVMLSPQSMSVENYFDREDLDKIFIKEQIMKAENPEKSMKNYLACMAQVNSKEFYDYWYNSGFFILERKDTENDTRKETFEVLSRHFELVK